MPWVAERKYRTGQLSLDYRERLAAKAAELRQAALNGETADDDRVHSIADALECSAYDSANAPRRDDGCNQ